MHIHTFPRVPLSFQASACSLSTLHFLKFSENSFEVLKLLENSVEVLKILENKLDSMKILENKLESLKLQENQPVDGLPVVVVLVAALGPEFVLGFAPLESSLSQLVLVSALLGLHLVSTLVHDESAVVYLVSTLVHLAIQTI
ncbi:hypothetical protein Tco_0691671 [Tanacetum coccineum]